MGWLEDVANGLSSFVSNLGKASGNTAAKADKSTSKTPTKKSQRVSSKKNTISVNDIVNAGKATGKAVSSAASNASKTTGATAAKSEDRDWQAAGGKTGGPQASILNDSNPALENAINIFQEEATKGLGEPEKYVKETQEEKGKRLDTERRKKEREENLNHTPDYEDKYDTYEKETEQVFRDTLKEEYGIADDDIDAFINSAEGQEQLKAMTLYNEYYDFIPLTSEGPYISPGLQGDWHDFVGKDIADLEDMWKADVEKATSEDEKERAGLQFDDDITEEELVEQGINPELLEQRRAAQEGNSKNSFVISGMTNPWDNVGQSDYVTEQLYPDLSDTETPEKYDMAMEQVNDDYEKGYIDEATREHLLMDYSTKKADAAEIEKQEELDPGSWQVDMMKKGVRDAGDIAAIEEVPEKVEKAVDELTTFYSGTNPDATDKEVRDMVDEQIQKEYGFTMDEIDDGILDNLSDQDYEDLLMGEGDHGGTMTSGHTYTPHEKVDVTKDAKVANIADDIEKAYESNAQYYKANNPDATDEEVEKNANEATASEYGVSYDDFSNYSDKEIEQYKKDVANGKIDGTMVQSRQVEQPTELTKNYSGLADQTARAFEKYVGFDAADIQDYIDQAEKQGNRTIPAGLVDNADNTRGEMMAQALANQFANLRKPWTDQAEYEITFNSDEPEKSKTYDLSKFIDEDTGEDLVSQDWDNRAGFVLSDGTFLPWGAITSDVTADEKGNWHFDDKDKTVLNTDQVEELQAIYDQAQKNSEESGYSFGKALQNLASIKVEGDENEEDDYINVDDYNNHSEVHQTEESKGPWNLGDTEIESAYSPLEGLEAEDILPAAIDTLGQSAAFMGAMGIGSMIPIPGAGTAAGFMLTQPQRSLRGKGYDPDTFDTDTWSFSSDPYYERQRKYSDFADFVDVVSEGLTGVAGNSVPKWLRRYARNRERPTLEYETGNGSRISQHAPVRDENGKLLKHDDRMNLTSYEHDAQGRLIPDIDETGRPILDYRGDPAYKINTDSIIDSNYMMNEPADNLTERFNNKMHSVFDKTLGKTRFGKAANITADIFETAFEEGYEELFSGIADKWEAATSNGIDLKDAFKNYDTETGEPEIATTEADVIKNIMNTELMNFGAGATLGGVFGAGKPLLDNLTNFYSRKFAATGAPAKTVDDAAKVAAETTIEEINKQGANSLQGANTLSEADEEIMHKIK